MTVWNVVEKLKHIEDLINRLDASDLKHDDYVDVKSILEEYRDRLLNMKVRE